MSVASPQDGGLAEREAKEWGLSLALVAALHLLPFILITFWFRPPVRKPVEPPLSAVMIDMAPSPAPASSPRPPVSPRPNPQPVETRRTPQTNPLPKLPVMAAAAATLPAVAEKPQPVQAPPQPAVSAPPAAPTVAAALPSAPPSKAASTWQGLILGRLERFKRYPDEASHHHQEGVAMLRFTMDREGTVLAASIEKGSGFDLLDAEALALVKRAQPLPKPPADILGDRLELVAPVEFFMRRRR